MKKVTIVWLAMLVVPTLSIPAAAQNLTDSAAQTAYADGWQDGDNGGTGFDPWWLHMNTSGMGTALAEVTIDSATLYGGSQHLDTMGRTMIMHAWDDGMSRASLFASRSWQTPLPSGAKIYFRAQHLGGFSGLEIFDGNTQLFYMESGSNWLVSLSYIDTGIPLDVPIGVLYTWVSESTYNLEVTDLTGKAPKFVLNGMTHPDSGWPTRISFGHAYAAGPGSYLLVNSLVVNPDGSFLEPMVFSDSFESGSTGSWSTVVQ